MDKIKISFVGNGTPLIDIIRYAMTLESIEVQYVFVSENEIDFVKKKLDSTIVENVANITANRITKSDFLNDCDYLISYNNMHIIDDKIIENLKCGGINYHAGSLPEYAGSYTYQWAIRNNEDRFCSTIHWIKGKTDEGPIITKKEFPITAADTGLSILIKSLETAYCLMKDVLKDIANSKTLNMIPQDLTKRNFYSIKAITESGQINWDDSAEAIERLIRASDFFPYKSPTYEPFTETVHGLMKIHKAKICSDRNLSNKTGRVVSVTNDCIVVSTGCRKGLSITSVTINKSKFKSGSMLETKIRAGELFKA